MRINYLCCLDMPNNFNEVSNSIQFKMLIMGWLLIFNESHKFHVYCIHPFPILPTVNKKKAYVYYINTNKFLMFWLKWLYFNDFLIYYWPKHENSIGWKCKVFFFNHITSVAEKIGLLASAAMLCEQLPRFRHVTNFDLSSIIDISTLMFFYDE